MKTGFRVAQASDSIAMLSLVTTMRSAMARNAK